MAIQQPLKDNGPAVFEGNAGTFCSGPPEHVNRFHIVVLEQLLLGIMVYLKKGHYQVFPIQKFLPKRGRYDSPHCSSA